MGVRWTRACSIASASSPRRLLPSAPARLARTSSRGATAVGGTVRAWVARRRLRAELAHQRGALGSGEGKGLPAGTRQAGTLL